MREELKTTLVTKANCSSLLGEVFQDWEITYYQEPPTSSDDIEGTYLLIKRVCDSPALDIVIKVCPQIDFDKDGDDPPEDAIVYVSLGYQPEGHKSCYIVLWITDMFMAPLTYGAFKTFVDAFVGLYVRV